MFNVSAQTNGAYVLMVVSGPARVPELCAGISFLAELLQRTQRQRVLLDMLGLAFVLDESADRTVLQHLMAMTPVMERLAIVVPRGESHGLVATAARAKGATVGEFDNLPDASAWVIG